MKAVQADSPTRQKLLDAAQRLMLAKGFSATTIDDICGAAKLTKGSFFHYFDSKDHLGKVLLERFCCSSATLHASMCGDETDPLKRLDAYLNAAIKLSKDPTFVQGCLLGCFAQELADTHPQIRSACDQGFREWAEQFGHELARAKAEYASRAAFNPRELAEHFIAVLEGSLILAKAKHDTKVIEQNVRHFQRYVLALLQR